MNASVYIFGKFKSGYTQYPEDTKKKIFISAAEYATSKTKIVIKRSGNLIYYIYSRKIKSFKEDTQSIGLALELNDAYTSDLSKMFSLFDEALTKLVLAGNIIEFNDEGDIVPKTESLYLESSEIENISNFLLQEVNHLTKDSFTKLPPVNYSIAAKARTRISDLSSPDEVESALNNYNIVEVCKAEGGGIPVLSGYSARLKGLSKQIRKLTEENETLSSNLVKVRRQKKRTTIVTSLTLIIAFIVVIGMIIGTSLSTQVKALEETLEERNEVIKTQKYTINMYIDENDKYKNSISNLRKKLATEEKRTEALKTENSALVSDNSSLRSQVNSLNGKITSLTLEIESLKTQNMALQNKNHNNQQSQITAHGSTRSSRR